MSGEHFSITVVELKTLPDDTYILYDIRSVRSFSYGCIPGAINISDIISAADRGELSKEKMLILYCMNGDLSSSLTDSLRRGGYDAFYIDGGYESWLNDYCESSRRCEEIDITITKRRRFKEKLFNRFTKAIVEFDMIKPGDKIAVCISGGKDSMLMAMLFRELKKHDKFPFELVFMVMDPGYNDLNRRMIESNAERLGIPIQIFDTRIFDSVFKVEKSPCYLCARMRRGYLYKQAKESGCNKIALGHHYDDVIETVLMGMLWGGQIQTMMPKLHSVNYEGMELIRPMYYVREEDIKAWRDSNRLRFIQCACRFTENTFSEAEGAVSDSKRLETKRLIQELRKTNPHVEANIFNSMHNVNIDTVIAYKKDGIVHHFTEDY